MDCHNDRHRVSRVGYWRKVRRMTQTSDDVRRAEGIRVVRPRMRNVGIWCWQRFGQHCNVSASRTRTCGREKHGSRDTGRRRRQNLRLLPLSLRFRTSGAYGSRQISGQRGQGQGGGNIQNPAGHRKGKAYITITAESDPYALTAIPPTNTISTFS